MLNSLIEQLLKLGLAKVHDAALSEGLLLLDFDFIIRFVSSFSELLGIILLKIVSAIILRYVFPTHLHLGSNKRPFIVWVGDLDFHLVTRLR